MLQMPRSAEAIEAFEAFEEFEEFGRLAGSLHESMEGSSPLGSGLRKFQICLPGAPWEPPGTASATPKINNLENTECFGCTPKILRIF